MARSASLRRAGPNHSSRADPAHGHGDESVVFSSYVQDGLALLDLGPFEDPDGFVAGAGIVEVHDRHALTYVAGLDTDPEGAQSSSCGA